MNDDNAVGQDPIDVEKQHPTRAPALDLNFVAVMSSNHLRAPEIVQVHDAFDAARASTTTTEVILRASMILSASTAKASCTCTICRAHPDDLMTATVDKPARVRMLLADVDGCDKQRCSFRQNGRKGFIHNDPP